MRDRSGYSSDSDETWQGGGHPQGGPPSGDMEMPEDGERPEMPEGMEAPKDGEMPEMPEDMEMSGGPDSGGQLSAGEDKDEEIVETAENTELSEEENEEYIKYLTYSAITCMILIAAILVVRRYKRHI